MAVFKCKMCGGALEIVDNQSVAFCGYCGTRQTLPQIDDEKKIALFNRANNLRFKSEFDKAAGIYESIIAEFPEEAEAYWGLVLCKYGIEYVDDKDGKKIATCHRTLPTPIMKDEDFQQACENADISARALYREEAKTIDGIQKRIHEIAATEEPYDIFICYKETDDITGVRTEDSSIAQDIYTAFTEMGYKVFFARNSLRKVAGTEYEPYIYAALSSAKIMLAIGTKFDYFDAVWVKNEWSRFISMVANDSSKILIPCYKNIDAYDIPEEFSNMQALDMADMMFFNSLEASVKRTLGENKETVKKAYSSESKNNFREIAFEDGYYVGEAVADQPNGYGTRVWTDGSKYEGEWKFGKYDGQGTYTNKDGSAWTGEFKNGEKRNGKGAICYETGNKYVGEIVNGKREGKGKFYWSDGDAFEGAFVNDKREGKGIYTHKDGNTWTGEFKDDKPWNGRGTLCFNTVNSEVVNGKREGEDEVFDIFSWVFCNYVGEIVNGKKEGQGKLYWSDGAIQYEGSFVNGKKEGQGKYTNKDGSTWTGEFKNDSQWNGRGTICYTNGNKYVGELVNGKCKGKASYYWANGDKYDGEFVNGKIEGQGTYINKDGSTWTGEFKDDKPWNGNGVWYNTDGSSVKGKIRKGIPTIFGSTRSFPK